MRNRQSKYITIQVAFILLVYVPALATQNAITPPSDVVRQYLSSDNLESAMGYLAPNYKLRFDRRPQGGMNKKQVARFLEWYFALNQRHRIDDIQMNGQEVVVKFHEENDFYLLIGCPGYDGVATFTVNESGMITSQLYMPEQGQPDLMVFLKEAISWLRENRPEVLDKIYPANRMIQTAETAREWVKILREWRAATGQHDPTRN